MRALLFVVLAGCSTAPTESTDSGAPWVAPGCGDGVLDAGEECDAGADNSDTTADACRTTCFLPTCGDAVVDAGEACDDGGKTGGDGCSPTCAAEAGTAEVEPNDSWDAATPGGAEVDGSLDAEDEDCFTVDVPACGAVAVTELAPCGPSLVLNLHGPDGRLVAASKTTAEGCAAIDPLTAPGARWMEEGTWSVCVIAENDAVVPGYALAISTPDPVAIGAPSTGDDTDADTIPDTCDVDLDGDGLANEDDNCPDVSNGPDTPGPSLSSDGYVRTWLSAGPFTGGVTTGECRPSEEAFVGEDGAIAPEVGDPAGSLMWTYALLTSNTYDMNGPYGWATPSREAYTLVYLESATARTLTLSLGADDGVFAWWNGAQVIDVGSCQGVNADQFQASVEVNAGWNTLLVKVRDWGGGWGLAARLLDNGAPVTDLVPSLTPGAEWALDQADHDGDGTGDACDETP